MGQVDYTYYRNTFGGSMIPADAFAQAVAEADAVLCALLYPKNVEDVIAGRENLYRRAICYEAEYLYSGSGAGVGVKSEKIGDYAVEYRAPAEKSGVSVNGHEVSPTAVSLLCAAGLMLRWV